MTFRRRTSRQHEDRPSPSFGQLRRGSERFRLLSRTEGPGRSRPGVYVRKAVKDYIEDRGLPGRECYV